MVLHLNIIFHKFDTEMKTHLLHKLFFIFFLVGLIGCENPQDIPSPTHYERVPQAKNLTAVVGDTTATGKYSISLNWMVSSMDNIKEFEVQKKGSPAFFVRRALTTTTAYLDTFSISFTDSMSIYYFIISTGKDRFVGLNSDTIEVKLKK